MKIVYVVSSMKKSGLTKVIFNLSKILSCENEVHIIEMKKDYIRSEYKDELLELGVKFHFVSSKWITLVGGFKKITDIIGLISPDVVHCHCFRSILLCSFFSNALPSVTVCTFHSYIFRNYAGEFGKVFGYLMARLITQRAKKFTARVSVSKSVAELFLKYKRIDSVPICNGVDFVPGVVLKNKSLDSDVINFIYTGSISNRKRVRFLCESFHRFMMEIEKEHYHKKCKLTLLGDGPLFLELKQTYESERVVFLGKVDDVNRYLSDADFFISASESEGLPNAVMESMSVGIPTILSDIPPHLELLEGTISGLSFSLGSYDSLRAVLLESMLMIDSRYSELSNNAKDKIRNEFNVASMAGKHFNLYKKLNSID